MEKMWPVANLFRAPMISISLLHPPPKRNKNAHHFCLSFPSPAHSRVKDIFHRGSRGKNWLLMMMARDEDRGGFPQMCRWWVELREWVELGEEKDFVISSHFLYRYILVNLWHLLVYFGIFTSTIQWLADEHEGIFHIKSRDEMEMLIVGSFPICFH